MAQRVFLKNYNSINLNQLDKISKYLLFEKVVIEHLDPEKHNIEGLFFYKGFEIGNTIVIPSFLPKINEKIKSNKQIKLNVKNKSFLLKQNELFRNNKLIDAIFINVNEKNEAELYCFHINPHQIKKNIYYSNSLENTFKDMKNYISNYFNFKIKTIYFHCIMDFKLSKKPEIKKLFEDFNNRKIYSFFFDLETSSFKDIFGNNMNLLKSMNNLKISEKINYRINNKINLSGKTYYLNEQQKGTIKEILRKTYKKIDNEFHFFKNDMLYINNINNFKAFCITEQSKQLFKTEYPETYMLFKGGDKKMNFIKLNKKGGYEVQSDLIYILCMGNDYDYYKIE